MWRAPPAHTNHMGLHAWRERLGMYNREALTMYIHMRIDTLGVTGCTACMVEAADVLVGLHQIMRTIILSETSMPECQPQSSV